VGGTAERGEIALGARVGGEQGGSPVGEPELVQVGLHAVTGMDLGDRAVGRVLDRAEALPVSGVARAGPVGEHGLALELLHPQIGDVRPGGLDPHRLARVLHDEPVEDLRLRLDEEQAEGGRARLPAPHVGHGEVGADEAPDDRGPCARGRRRRGERLRRGDGPGDGDGPADEGTDAEDAASDEEPSSAQPARRSAARSGAGRRALHRRCPARVPSIVAVLVRLAP
jgi:hypothetical protein